MKKANKYFEDYWVSKTGKPLDEATEYYMSYAIDAIKQAQLDAIEETVKLCAEKSQVEVVDHEELYISSLPGYDRKIDQVILPIYGVDEESILNCADILKKELE